MNWLVLEICAPVFYLLGVFVITHFLAIGEVQWWERLIAWFWPVTLPGILVTLLVKEIFWP